jgi:acyl dehydratase
MALHLHALRAMAVTFRFTKPVLPGETLRFEFFEDAAGLRFRAVSVEQGAIVMDRCSATMRVASLGL